MADPASELEAALAATAAALDAGDAEGAAAASAKAAGACAALQAAGTRLPREALLRLSELQARCQAGAGAVMGKLGADLSAAARGTRAVAAYRR